MIVKSQVVKMWQFNHLIRICVIRAPHLETMLQVLLLLMQCSFSGGTTILNLPLDERFTTRNAFLNLAKVTPYNVDSVPFDYLPRRKEPAALNQIHDWVDVHANEADAGIVSLEMYLYGGLIASRTSNDTTEVIRQRWHRLRKIPNLTLLASSVVMRIPAYNGDEEEPWYWAFYGRDLFEYSYYTGTSSKT